MEMRHLGRSGIVIPPLVFGGNVFGWSADQATSFRLLDALREAGLTALDTADMYSVWAPGHKGGESETVIGNWLAARGGRDKLVIMTKVGMDMPDGRGLSAAWIKTSADRSLKRLRTDVIDLYQSHQDDGSVPLEETLGAYADLIKAGKVRAIGASNYTAPRLAEALAAADAHGLPRYATLQPHYNLLERPLFEDALESVCQENGLGVIPYFSLAAGFLTGKYRSEADLGKSAARGQGVAKYLSGRGPAVLAALDAMAAETRTTPARVALAWLMARPSITAPIASASRPEQMEDIVKACALSLSSAQIAALDAASV